MQKPAAAPVVEYALFSLLALLWGASYLFAKIALAEIPPLTLVAVRVSTAAAILLGVLAVSGDAPPRGGAVWRRLFVQAIFNSIGAWTVLAWAQQRLDASLASVLNSTAPIFVFLITAIWTRHEATNGVKLTGAVVGLAGVALVVGVDADNGGGVLGGLAALFGAFLYACAAIYGRRFDEMAPAATAAGTMLWASAVLIPAALALETPWRLRPSGEAIAAAVVLGVFCTGLALLIYFRLLRTLGSLGVASQSYLRAGVGALLGIVVLGESLTGAVAVGVGLAILGVALMNFRRRA